MKHDINEPYYAKHTIMDLTCPHCSKRLLFIINQDGEAVYTCSCGRWYRTVAFPGNNHAGVDRWRYEKTDMEHTDETI